MIRVPNSPWIAFAFSYDECRSLADAVVDDVLTVAGFNTERDAELYAQGMHHGIEFEASDQQAFSWSCSREQFVDLLNDPLVAFQWFPGSWVNDIEAEDLRQYLRKRRGEPEPVYVTRRVRVEARRVYEFDVRLPLGYDPHDERSPDHLASDEHAAYWDQIMTGSNDPANAVDTLHIEETFIEPDEPAGGEQ